MIKLIKINYYQRWQIFNKSALFAVVLFLSSNFYSQITIKEGTLVYGDSLMVSENKDPEPSVGKNDFKHQTDVANADSLQSETSIVKKQKSLKERSFSKINKQQRQKLDEPEQLINKGSSSDHTFNFVKQNPEVFIIPQNFQFLKIAVFTDKHIVFYNNHSENNKMNFSNCKNRNHILFTSKSSRAPPLIKDMTV